MHFAVGIEVQAWIAGYHHSVRGAQWLQRMEDFENARSQSLNAARSDAVPLVAANAWCVELVIYGLGQEPTIGLPLAVVVPDPIHLHLQVGPPECLVASEENVP